VARARVARLGVGVGLVGGLARAQLAWAQEQLARLGESAERSAR
jgi:hypothetical protein